MKRFVLVLALLAASCSPQPTELGALRRGTPAALDGTLQSMEGKPVVVNYWATWCAPCKKEMPRIVAAARKYRDDVGFLGINVTDDAEAANAFIEEYGIEFVNLSDPDGEIRRAQKIAGLPVTQFYTSDGELAFVHQGEIKTDDLERKIQDAIDASR